MNNELITLEQAVKLTSRFDEITAELERKKSLVEAMLVTEDSRKDAKSIRAQLNKESKVYAEEFKTIKAAVLEPWNQVETEYKEKIAKQYASMDVLLKTKIDEIEDGLKKEKETELVEFFEESKLALGLLFVEFADLDIKVGLSTSLAGCKKEIKGKLDGISDDLSAIGDNAEVLAEYQNNGFKLSLAIQTINERKQAIRHAEELKAKREREAEEEAQRIAEMEKATQSMAPEAAEVKIEQPKEEKKYKTSFEVYGTLEQLKALKQFLEGAGIGYAQR